MIDLFATARQLQSFCDGQGWRSCFIGGIAVQRWGEPRVTRDVDLTLLAGFGGEERFIDPLLAAYPARIGDAGGFARRYRALLLRTPDGVGIDISLGALEFEERVVSRATIFSFGPGLDIRTCSAEDLVVLKLFAFRPLDVRDAEGVALRQRAQLDWQCVEDELRPLAEVKQDPEILRTLARLRRL
ncbi:MAG: nucleotidyl transferase AbiEii/AbiGii toxin family protein [Acidobacteriia bacterium]|nr:nucleotidyl transferase AbiEii/AbiGii toxin family protein [Terriglobia bacterium]